MGTRTGYWKPSQRGTDETPKDRTRKNANFFLRFSLLMASKRRIQKCVYTCHVLYFVDVSAIHYTTHTRSTTFISFICQAKDFLKKSCEWLFPSPFFWNRNQDLGQFMPIERFDKKYCCKQLWAETRVAIQEIRHFAFWRIN